MRMNVHSHTSPDDRREAILAAALELFVNSGFDGTSVPAVAKAAGVATGTIYRHFASKEALVNALYRRWKQRLMQALTDGFDPSLPPRELFRDFFHRLAGFAAREPRALAFLELHHHQPYLDADSRALELDSLAPIHALVQSAQRAGAVRDTPAEALMAMVWGAFVGLFKADRDGHLEMSPTVLDAIEDSLWNAVKRPQGEPS